jgi:hypothetical protein
MAGLLDYGQPDPLTLGLLGFSQAISTPRSRGGGVAAALGAFPAGQMQAAEMQRQREQDMLRQQLQQAQIGKYQFDMGTSRATSEQAAAQAAAQAQARAEFESAYGQSGGQWSPQLSILGTRAGFKTEDLQRLAQGGNLGREKLTFQNGVGVNPFDGSPQAVVPDVNQPFNPTIGPGGITAVPNQPVQDFQVRRSAAGAPNITTRVENKGADSAMGQYGPILKEQRTAAQGAIEQFDSADRIEQALNSGAVNIGPGSTVRNKIDQLSVVLGVAGENTQARVARTRQMIRGLSEMAVKARQALAGQGTITDKESETVARAYAADPEDVTLDELRIIVDLTKRAARLQAESYQQMLQSAPAGVAPFYQIPRLNSILSQPPAQAPAAIAPTPANPNPAAPSPGQVVDGYQFMGGDPANPKSWRQTR